jgi:hypothetical protein
MHRELWAVGKTVGLVDPSGLAFWLLGSLFLALLLLGVSLGESQPLSVFRGILGSLSRRFPFQPPRGTPSPEARFRAALEASLDAIYLLEAVRDPATREIRDFVFADVNAKGEELISRQPPSRSSASGCASCCPSTAGGAFSRNTSEWWKPAFLWKRSSPFPGSRA